MWQRKSNDVTELNKMGVHIWDQWKQEDAPLDMRMDFSWARKRIVNGEKVDQVDYLLHQLKNNPSSRRQITMLWNPDESDSMALTPCVYETQWYEKQGT
ncbi:thymidylate synthase [Bacillus sp. 3A_MP1]